MKSAAFKLFSAEIDVNNSCNINMMNYNTTNDNIESNHNMEYINKHSNPITMIKLFGTDIVVNPITTAASCMTDEKSSSSSVSDHEEEEEEEELTKLRISPDATSTNTIQLNPRQQRKRQRAYPSPVRSVWKIRKRLTQSDVNGLSRLLVSSKLMEEEVLPLMEADMRWKVDDSSSGGLKVEMVDDDTGIVHHNMVLKLWPSCCSYVINGSWSQFCKSRNLRANDEIGLRWDPYNRRFHFSLLRRATASPQPIKSFFRITRLPASIINNQSF